MSGDYDPPQTPLDILHQDHEILVVNKPAGLLSVPGKGDHLADCLLARVQTAFPEALLVHRLDRDTSGVMIFALTPRAQRHLGLQFERRHVKKTYVARVWGEVAEKTGTVDLPLIVDWPNRPKQKVDFETGRPAADRLERGAGRGRNHTAAPVPPHRSVAPVAGAHGRAWPPDPGRSVLCHGTGARLPAPHASRRGAAHPAPGRRGWTDLQRPLSILTAGSSSVGAMRNATEELRMAERTRRRPRATIRAAVEAPIQMRAAMAIPARTPKTNTTNTMTNTTGSTSDHSTLQLSRVAILAARGSACGLLVPDQTWGVPRKVWTAETSS